MIRYSRGLAEIKDIYGTKTIQFIHQSVSDFFAEIGLQIIDLDCGSKDSAIGRAHLFLSRSCINFIATEDVQELDKVDGVSWYLRYRGRVQADETLATYATKYWTARAQNAEMKNTQTDILEPLGWPSKYVFEKWKRMSRIIDRYNDKCPNKNTSMLHTLYIHRLIAPLSIILRRTNEEIYDMNIQDANGRTSLSLAAEKGHTAVVEILLGKGADPNYLDETKRSPLSRAAANGHTAIVGFFFTKALTRISMMSSSKRRCYGQQRRGR